MRILLIFILFNFLLLSELSAVNLYINEFMASNNTFLQDPQESSDYPDWIELYNGTDNILNIGNMYLTDNPDSFTKWRIPEGVSIPANGYLLFYADNDTIQGERHTGFKLNADLGIILLINRDGTTIIDSVSYCCQERDMSYGRYPDGAQSWYLNAEPTPNKPNTQGYAGRIADLQFSHERGFYDQAIKVAITCLTSDITIHYTLDGSEPGMTESSLVFRYTQPVDINTTTCLRAIAFKQGWKSTEVNTYTYIYLNDVIRQPALPSGFPANWGHTGNGDYEMDPDVTNNQLYSGTIKDDLKSLPSLSLVMNTDDWLGNNGIYRDGELEERAVSAELIFPDQTPGFQINCAVMIVGGTSVNRWKMDKLSMRLKFKSNYGPSTLQYPLFGSNLAQEFNTLVVDARMNNSWAYGGTVTVNGRDLTQRDLAQYTRDQFVADLQNQMGGFAPHGRHVQLYINGLYWGLYWLHERPDEFFASAYLGGNPEDFDVLKHNSTSVLNGSDEDYEAMMQLAGSGLQSNSAYQEMASYLDIPDFIDYMLVNYYMGNWDWAHQNWYVSKNRTSADGKWRYHSWDAEHVMEGLTNNVTDKNDEGGPTYLHTQLMENQLYRLRFADHVYRHFFNDGIFTPDKIKSLYQLRLDEVDRAVVGESARWGDNQRDVPYTRNIEWIRERNWLMNTFFPERAAIVLEQLQDKGLYWTSDVPQFFINDNPAVSGFVSRGDIFSMESASGTIYYTENGDDPLNFGDISDMNYTTLVPEDATKYVLVPEGDMDNNWHINPGYDDSGWMVCSGGPGGIGYERASGYETFISLDLGPVMYTGGSNPNTSCFIRIPFNLTESDLSSIKSLFLEIRFDDGFIAYINTKKVASANAPPVPRWDSQALEAIEAGNPVRFDLSGDIDKMQEGDNLLAIHGLNASETSSDFLITAKLIAGDRSTTANTISDNAMIYSDPIVISKSIRVKARNLSNGKWSPVNSIQFIVPTYLEGLIISEIHYHPQPEDTINDREFEFIEMKNISNRTLNLGNISFVQGIAYTFPESALLKKNEFLVLASDKDHFEKRYNFTPFGVYEGNLNNGGERITVLDSTADTLLSMRYDDQAPWPAAADGQGYSLVLKNDNILTDYKSPESWRASYQVHGSPGKEDTTLDSGGRNFIPDNYYLYQNYPNPFNSGTTIEYDLPVDTDVTIAIYNLRGQLVRGIVNLNQTRGNYSVRWDGINNNGNRVATGIYICHIRAKGFQFARKLVLIR